MTELTTQPTSDIKDKGLLARFTGVLFSPRETFAVVAQWPRPLVMLLFVMGVSAVLAAAFYYTEVGQQTFLDAYERAGNAQQLEIMQKVAARMWIIAPVMAVIITPIFYTLIAGILLGIFTMLGGDAKFKQVFSVVVHTGGAIGILAQIVMLPLQYITASSRVVTNASVFFPMLDDKGFLYNVVSKVDLFWIWMLVTVSIGLGVLYRRKTGPIAVGFFVIYALIALGIAALQAARS